MRSAEQNVIAAAPRVADVEILERKLMELRAQIDAILAQLSSQKATASSEPAEEHQPLVAAAIPIEDPAEPETGLNGTAQATPGARAMSEVSEQLADPAEASEPVAATAITHDHVEPIAVVDVDSHVAEMSCETALEPPAQAEAVGQDTAMAAAEAISLEQAPTSKPAAECATDATEAARIEAPAVAAAAITEATGAQVIDFGQHQRKQKASMASSGTAPVRRSRRLATKIAASIIALIAAATALVLTEGLAVESAQSLPWGSPQPTHMPSGESWSIFGQQKRADDTGGADGRAASTPPAVASEALLARYREVWLVSP
jgi:hypothetical protein